MASRRLLVVLGSCTLQEWEVWPRCVLYSPVHFALWVILRVIAPGWTDAAAQLLSVLQAWMPTHTRRQAENLETKASTHCLEVLDCFLLCVHTVD